MLKVVMCAGAFLCIMGCVLVIVKVIVAFKVRGIKKSFRETLSSMEENVEKSRKVIGKTAKWLILIGVILFVLCYIQIEVPRGNDSIFSKTVKGALKGENHTKQQEENTQYEEMADFGETDIIVIEGKIIRCNGHSWQKENIEEFGLYLDTIEQTGEFSLQDDYAVSAVYHKVEEFLQERGIVYVAEEGSE